MSCLLLQADTRICDFMRASSRDRTSDSFTFNKNQSPISSSHQAWKKKQYSEHFQDIPFPTWLIGILTEIRVVEQDELLPAVLRHHLHDDLVQIDGWADHQGVVVGAWQAAGHRAGGSRRPCRRALDEEVGDVHCIGQGLEAPCRHAADGADQGEDAAVHQLTGLERGGEKQERKALLSKRQDVVAVAIHK